MKKLGFILFSGFILLLSGCGQEASQRESIDELQVIISAQEGQIAELQAQLDQLSTEEAPAASDDWNRFVDTQASDEVLWHGLTVGEIKQDLLANEALIPIEPMRDGVLARFDLGSIYVGNQTVLAYASDGHWEEQIFLSYQVENETITWTVIAYTYEGELHLSQN